MATTTEKQPVAAVAEAAPAPAAERLTLTVFCTRLSETVRRPELIGAFESTERTAGRSQATEAEFRARFVAFSRKPV